MAIVKYGSLAYDTEKKIVGKLTPSGKGGYFVDDKWYEKSKIPKIKTKREEYLKDINSRHHGYKKDYYKKIVDKWEKQYQKAKTEPEWEMAKHQKEIWQEQYDIAKEKEDSFNNSYNNPKEEKYVSKVTDYNAKTRADRYANYAVEDIVAKNKDIENDIRSLYIYQKEKNMGSGQEEPLKRYYDKYGKKDVDSVWKSMDRKYAIIEGTSMDSEGLRYNDLVEKGKYSQEAINNYRNKINEAYRNYWGNSSDYNKAVGKAREEFENSNKLNKGDAFQNKMGTVVEIKDIDDKGQVMHSFQSSPTSPPHYHTYMEKDVKRMLELNGYEKVSKDDTSPMSEYSDTTGTGYTDKQTKALESGAYDKRTASELRKQLKSLEPYTQELQVGDRVIVNTGGGRYGVRNKDDYDDPMTDYSAYVYGFNAKSIIERARENGIVVDKPVSNKVKNAEAKVERYRQRKQGTTIDTMSKRQLATRIAEIQAERGIISKEDIDKHITRKMRDYTKKQLKDYFK